DEITALVQDSHPYHVGRLLPLPRRGRINRRAAAWTERLQASIAALGRGLEVCRRLARYAKGCTGNGNINAEGGAGANLAIRAVANRGLLGVRFAFDRDIAAVARAVDFHEFVPFRRSASAIAFIGTPAQVSDILRPSRRLDRGWAVAMLRAARDLETLRQNLRLECGQPSITNCLAPATLRSEHPLGALCTLPAGASAP